MPDIRKDFDQAMFTIYRRAKSEANYNATIFLSMLSSKGGLATAKYLINASSRLTAIHTFTSEADWT